MGLNLYFTDPILMDCLYRFQVDSYQMLAFILKVKMLSYPMWNLGDGLNFSSLVIALVMNGIPGPGLGLEDFA